MQVTVVLFICPLQIAMLGHVIHVFYFVLEGNVKKDYLITSIWRNTFLFFLYSFYNFDSVSGIDIFGTIIWFHFRLIDFIESQNQHSFHGSLLK